MKKAKQASSTDLEVSISQAVNALRGDKSQVTTHVMTYAKRGEILKMGYDADAQRYTIGEYGLHAGDPVTVVNADGTETQSRIEFDQARNIWFVVGYEGKYPEDLEYRTISAW